MNFKCLFCDKICEGKVFVACKLCDCFYYFNTTDYIYHNKYTLIFCSFYNKEDTLNIEMDFTINRTSLISKQKHNIIATYNYIVKDLRPDNLNEFYENYKKLEVIE